MNRWLDAHQIFMDIYSWDITKNQLDFDDLDLIFKVTAVEKTENPVILSCLCNTS